MLRITQEGDADTVSLRLEGRLEGVWVDILRKAWEDVLTGIGERALTIDLGSVSFADREGRSLLLAIERRGAVLARVSGFLKHILVASDDDLDRKGD